MPEYKKKNVKKIKSQKPKRSAVASNYKVTALNESDFVENISVKSAKQARAERKFQKKKERYLKREQPEKRVVNSNKSPRELNRTSGSLRVVKGARGAKKVRNFATITVAIAVIGCVMLIHFLSPTGIADLIECGFAKMGSGSGFPLTVSGGSVSEVVSTDDCITVISDTYIEIYNSASKELVSRQHKFSNPKSVTSKTRTLIYDQGATGVSVYDVSGDLFHREMKETIVTAAIGRNGTYCVVTDPEGIAAKVYVYDKNNKLRFKWQSDTDLINAAAISDNGRYVLLATANAKNGEFSSQLKVFEGKNSKPVREEKIKDIIHSVEAISNKRFIVRQGSEIKSYNAGGGIFADIIDESVRQKYNNKNGELVLYTDSESNTGKATFFNKYLEKEYEVEIIASPNNIEWNDKYIVCSKDYSLYVYDYSGKEINKINTNTPIEWFKIGEDNILAINNTTIVSHNLQGGDEK